jgi:type IV secretory pathway protease TraF
MSPRNHLFRIGVLALAGIGLALASFGAARPMFVWNFTASAPVGLYLVLARPWARGDWVAVRPSPDLARTLAHFGALERGRFLMKRVAAAEGDQVCRNGVDIAIDGEIVARARTATSSGELLPAWEGCRILRVGEVFLLGDAAGSFDGRYFGVTASSEIVAAVRALRDPRLQRARGRLE